MPTVNIFVNVTENMFYTSIYSSVVTNPEESSINLENSSISYIPIESVWKADISDCSNS